VIYLSDFVSELFHHRFRPRPGLRELVAYPSLDIEEYKGPAAHYSSQPGHILVIGNRFDHKRVKITVNALSQAFPQEKIVAVGAQFEGEANVISFAGGSLECAKLQELYLDARFVVYPSVYEGFGLPVLESLACEKPILARSIPVIRDIREKIANPNLILFSSTSELIARLREGFPDWVRQAEGSKFEPYTWEAATLRIGTFLTEIVAAVDFENVLMPRIAHMHLLGQRAEATGEVTPIFGVPEQRIQRVYASWSWKLTAPLRWLGAAYQRAKGH